jgi:hypothetical protein
LPDGGPDGTTTARVTYDITALNDQGAGQLREFAAGYDEYLRPWQNAIAALRPTVGPQVR